MADADSLKDVVLRDVPSEFFKRIVARQPALYAESHELSFKNPSWLKSEGEMVQPHIVRALMENEFRMAAKQCGLQDFDRRHAGDNSGYVLVASGTLRMTIHHVGGPGQFVPAAVSRRQNAAVNRFLDHLVLDGTLNELLPILEESGTINAYILHGFTMEKRAGKEYVNTFLRVAFPDSELKSYARNYDVPELLQAYGLIEIESRTPAEIADGAVPVLNPKKKKDVAN